MSSMPKKVRADLEALKQRLIEEARAEEDAVDVDSQVDEVADRFVDDEEEPVTVYGSAHADLSQTANDNKDD